MNLYVGNLAYSMRDEDLNDLFSAHGTVDAARVIMDRIAGRSKGFGFVEMSDEAAAKAAVEAINGIEVDGRNLVVNEARPREPRRGGRDSNRGGRDSNRGSYNRDY